MDMNDFRAWFTLVMFVMFVLIVIWAWSHKRIKDFREAANLPLDEPEKPRPLHDKNGGDTQ